MWIHVIHQNGHVDAHVLAWRARLFQVCPESHQLFWRVENVDDDQRKCTAIVFIESWSSWDLGAVSSWILFYTQSNVGIFNRGCGPFWALHQPSCHINGEDVAHADGVHWIEWVRVDLLRNMPLAGLMANDRRFQPQPAYQVFFLGETWCF